MYTYIYIYFTICMYIYICMHIIIYACIDNYIFTICIQQENLTINRCNEMGTWDMRHGSGQKSGDTLTLMIASGVTYLSSIFWE